MHGHCWCCTPHTTRCRWSPPDPATALARTAVATIMADLQAMVAHVSAPPTAALTTAGGPRLSGEPLLLDAMTARQLQLLGTVAAVPVAARFLGEPTQLRTLLSLVALGSLRVRRSALRTLRAVLPATPPEVAASAVAGLGRDGSGTGDGGVGGGAGAGAGAGAGGDSAPANGVLLFLLDIVGQVTACTTASLHWAVSSH